MHPDCSVQSAPHRQPAPGRCSWDVADNCRRRRCDTSRRLHCPHISRPAAHCGKGTRRLAVGHPLGCMPQSIRLLAGQPTTSRPARTRGETIQLHRAGTGTRWSDLAIVIRVMACCPRFEHSDSCKSPVRCYPLYARKEERDGPSISTPSTSVLFLATRHHRRASNHEFLPFVR
jgi:hypothetical protein